MLTWSPPVPSPTSGSQPIWTPAGVPPGNQSVANSVAFVELPLTKTADWPGARLLTPSSGTEEEKSAWLSFIRQPVRSTLPTPTFVSSNQSALNGLSPLDQGAISVTATSASEVPPWFDCTVSLYGALTASGLVPAAGSSTWTVTS